MKMSEIMGSSSAPRRGLHHRFLHQLAGAHLLNAVDDHVLAFFEARRDDHIGVAVGAGLHRAPLDLVLAVDDERIVAGLINLEGSLRDDQARRILKAAPAKLVYRVARLRALFKRRDG
jgi:hypothetical protein